MKVLRSLRTKLGAMLLAALVAAVPFVTPRAAAQTNVGIAFNITPNIFTAGQPASAVLSVSSTGLPSPVLQPGDTFYFGFSPSIGALASVVTPVMANSSTLKTTDFSVALGSGNTQVIVTYINTTGKTFGYGDAFSVKINFTASAQTGSSDISFNSRFTHVVNGLSPYATVSIVNFGTGPAGAPGPPGPAGPPGPQGPAGATFNPLGIALLRWYQNVYPANNFTVGQNPTEIAFDGASMWVTNASSNSVTRLQANDGTVLGTHIVGAGPAGIAYDGANIWVANTGDNTVTRIGARDGGIYPIVTVGTAPSGLAFDGANMWVTNTADNTVTRLSKLGVGAIKTTFPVGSFPLGIAFDGANIWVANGHDNTVTRLRASDGSNQGTFAVGLGPNHIAFDGTNIWVTNTGGGTVTKLRAGDGAVQGTFPVGFANPIGIAFDGANMWVTASGVVVKLRASDGATLSTVDLAGTLGGLAFDGANMWVAEVTSGTVAKL